MKMVKLLANYLLQKAPVKLVRYIYNTCRLKDKKDDIDTKNHKQCMVKTERLIIEITVQKNENVKIRQSASHGLASMKISLETKKPLQY